MDEMRIALNSKLMRNAVTKIIAKAIFKKTGYKVGVQINEIEAKNDEKSMVVHVDADVELGKDDILKIIKSVGLD